MFGRGFKILVAVLFYGTLAACGGGDKESASVVSVVHAFNSQSGDYGPYALVSDSQGNLYGTTSQTGYGSVFKIDSAGDTTILHQFDGTDGSAPWALISLGDGTLYGVTQDGGAYGWGTVFKLTSDGGLTTLHSFNGPDGFTPSKLILGADGNLYGITNAGGATYTSSRDASLTGAGEVFRISSAGDFSVLYSFSGLDGYFPTNLLQGSDGSLYGSTAFGGSAFTSTASSEEGNGTIFKLSVQGSLTTIYTFDSFDGVTSLIEAADGNLYGTTYSGGPAYYGSVFELTTSGTFTQLHAFSGPDGMFAESLVQASDGNLYGATAQGGSDYKAGSQSLGDGVIFSLGKSQAFMPLYSFMAAVGAGPVLTGPAGATAFYGVANQAGPDGGGIVFKFDPSMSTQ